MSRGLELGSGALGDQLSTGRVSLEAVAVPTLLGLGRGRVLGTWAQELVRQEPAPGSLFPRVPLAALAGDEDPLQAVEPQVHPPPARTQTPVSRPEGNRPGHRAGQLWDRLNTHGVLGTGGDATCPVTARLSPAATAAKPGHTPGAGAGLGSSVRAKPMGWRRGSSPAPCHGERSSAEDWHRSGGGGGWVLLPAPAPLPARRLLYPSGFGDVAAGPCAGLDKDLGCPEATHSCRSGRKRSEVPEEGRGKRYLVLSAGRWPRGASCGHTRAAAVVLRLCRAAWQRW